MLNTTGISGGGLWAWAATRGRLKSNYCVAQ